MRVFKKQKPKNKKTKSSERKTYNVKRKNAFSLIEIMVSLGIVSVIIIIFFNALLISINVTVRNTFRSNIREEISKVVSLISKDIRASDSIDTSTCINNSCEFSVFNSLVTWELCGQRICKTDAGGNIIFQSPVGIIIDTFTFEQGYVDVSSSLKNNILITVIARSANQDLKITNVIRQASVSTRNYEL